MTWYQRVSMLAAAVLMCTLSVATSCTHAQPVPDTQQQQQLEPLPAEPAPDPADASAPAPLQGVKLKKPSWWPHFVPEVVLKGEITPKAATDLQEVVRMMNASRHDPQQDPVEAVVLIIDSPGGFVAAGSDMVRSLQSLEMPLVCVVSGTAASMAALLLEVACPVRIATGDSGLMLHEPSFGREVSMGGGRWDLRGVEESLRVLTEGWFALVSRRTGIPLETLMARIKGDQWWLTADQALHANALDGICWSGIARDVTVPLQSTMELSPELGIARAKLQAPAPTPHKP